MKHRKVIYLSGTTIAALALSFSPARANDQSKPTAGQHSSAGQSTEGQAYSQSQNPSQAQSGSSASATGSVDLDRPASASSAMSGSGSFANQGSSSQGLRVASESEAKQTADKLSGQKLRGQDGKDVGTIKDFLVDSRSGQIRYAVVSSGGFFGLGERLRLIPYEMLQAQANGEGFTASVTKQQLDSVPTVDDKELDSARVTLDAQQQQQTQQALGSSGSPQSDSSSMTGSSNSGFASTGVQTQGQSNEFVRASKMKDSEVQANGSKIGSIENIVIEQGGGEAMALVNPESNIASDDQKFLVPLSQIQLGNSEKQVTTTLTQNDFQAAAQASAGTSQSQSSSSGMAATSQTYPGATAGTDVGATSSTSNQPSETGLAPEGGVSNATSTSATVASTDNPSASATTPSATGSQSGFGSTESTTHNSATQSSGSTSVAANTGSTTSDTSRSVWSDDKSSTGVASTEQSQVQGDATTRQGSEPAIAGVYGDMNAVHDDENDPAEKAAANNRPIESTQSGAMVNSGQQSSTPEGYASTDDVASTPEGRVNNDDSTISPTGATSADQSPNAKPELISAAQQIRQAFDQNDQLSSEKIQVTPQGEKIVLRGSVTSDALKTQAEELAKGSANEVEVDNQIEVKQR